MSLLARVQRGRTPKPPRILLYVPERIGKSTFGSQAPKPVFVPIEDGLNLRYCLVARFQSISCPRWYDSCAASR